MSRIVHNKIESGDINMGNTTNTKTFTYKVVSTEGDIIVKENSVDSKYYPIDDLRKNETEERKMILMSAIILFGQTIPTFFHTAIFSLPSSSYMIQHGQLLMMNI